jgi:sulfur relay (sulfurtransferase) complex TusBCD TusD component (DsrE family)
MIEDKYVALHLSLALLLNGHLTRIFFYKSTLLNLEQDADIVSRYIGLALAMTSALAIGRLFLKHDRTRHN